MGLDVMGHIYLGVPLDPRRLYDLGEEILRCTGRGKHEQEKGRFCAECGARLEKAPRIEKSKLHRRILEGDVLEIFPLANQEDKKPNQYFIGLPLSKTQSHRMGCPYNIVPMDKFREVRSKVQKELNKHALGEPTLLNFVVMSY